MDTYAKRKQHNAVLQNRFIAAVTLSMIVALGAIAMSSHAATSAGVAKDVSAALAE